MTIFTHVNTQSGEQHEMEIDLVPLRTGNLVVPRIEITFGASEWPMTFCHLNQGEQFLVRPKKSAFFTLHDDQVLRGIEGEYFNDGHKPYRLNERDEPPRLPSEYTTLQISDRYSIFG